MSYYILCKCHGLKKDYALLFWGPNHQGYTYNLDKAGVYSEEHIKKYFATGIDRNMPVSRIAVDTLAQPSIIDNSDLGRVCCNTLKNRKALGVSLRELRPGATNWGATAFSTVDQFKQRHKNTVRLLAEINEKFTNKEKDV